MKPLSEKDARSIIALVLLAIVVAWAHGCAHKAPQPEPCHFVPVDGGYDIVCQ